jgi:hypothetical protein
VAGRATRRAGKKRLDEEHTRALRWAEQRASQTSEQDYPLPEDCQFYDLARATDIYNLLEQFADGWGGWRFMDVLGEPLAQLSEPLVSDLITLRRFAGIAERRRKTQKDGEDGR